MGINHAARNFQGDGVDAVTVLLDQYDLVVRGDRYDVHPVGAVQDKKVVLLPVAWRTVTVLAQGEDTAGINGLRAETLPGTDILVRVVSHQNVKRKA